MKAKLKNKKPLSSLKSKKICLDDEFDKKC